MPLNTYPPLKDCIETIAARTGSNVLVVSFALSMQASELGMPIDELVHLNYDTAIGRVDDETKRFVEGNGKAA